MSYNRNQITGIRLKRYVMENRMFTGCVHDKTDYDKVMEELEVDEELKKDIKEEIRQSLKAFESVPEEKTDEKNLDALLERLMKDYHRSTGS